MQYAQYFDIQTVVNFGEQNRSKAQYSVAQKERGGGGGG